MKPSFFKGDDFSHGSYIPARVYKQGRKHFTPASTIIADSINTTTVLLDEDYAAYEVQGAFLLSNLICGCEVTILEDGEQLLTLCSEERCYSHKVA